MKDAQDYIHLMLPFSSKFNVLYAEDDEALREHMFDLLQSLFKSVTCASDGQEAFDLIKKNSYDILITDINMPNMNGIELIKEVKIKDPNQMILVLSAYNTPQYLIPLLKMGVNNYLIKPFDLQRFSMTLLKCVLVIEDMKNTQEKQKILKEELLHLRKENKELKELLSKDKPTVSKKIEIKPVENDNKENVDLDKLIELLGIDTIESAQKLDELIESTDFLINKLKNNSQSRSELVTIGDLYFELSKEFSLLGSLNIYSENLKELAFELYDPNLSLDYIEKIRNILIIINDNLQNWVDKILLKRDHLSVTYLKEDLEKDVKNILSFIGH